MSFVWRWPAAERPGSVVYGAMEASSGPLVIRRTFRYAPPPWRVFDALADEAHQWWCHRVAPRATVSFKPFEGGRFVQTAGGHQVDYAHVVLIERPRILRLEGAFGTAMFSATLNISGACSASAPKRQPTARVPTIRSYWIVNSVVAR